MSTKFRPQRGGLAEAMREVVEVENRDELAAHIGYPILRVVPYGGIDERIGWDTYVVVARYPYGDEIAGFTNGPLP